MDEETRRLIRQRRKEIQSDAKCVGCGATLADCKANRGKDPTAPPWFGCCAQGLDMRPCDHRVDAGELTKLIKEIESGEIRSLEQVLLDSVSEFQVTDRAMARMIANWDNEEGWKW